MQIPQTDPHPNTENGNKPVDSKWQSSFFAHKKYDCKNFNEEKKVQESKYSKPLFVTPFTFKNFD